MRVAFVQTYPIYHDLWSQEAWLALENRDRWMPGLVASMGHEVELLAGARQAATVMSDLDGFAPYRIRLFEASGGRTTKRHASDALVEHTHAFDPHICVLKGVDGGVGERLLRRYLLPEHRRFVFVIGGKSYARFVPRADLVFYETEAQRERLAHPRLPWRRAVPDDRLLRLPKSIDVDRFRPMPEIEPEWDVVAVGRLVERIKNFEALGPLSEVCRVAVVGGGPSAASLRSRFPKVDWLGQVPNEALPSLLNRARLLMHPGLREHYPRVLAEAAACGLPAVAFASGIAPDVLPAERGLRVDPASYVDEVLSLLADSERRAKMSRRSRAFAEASLGKDSSRIPLQAMLERLAEQAPHPV